MKTAGNIFLKIVPILVLMGVGIIATADQDKPLAVTQPAKKEVPRITFKNLSPFAIKLTDRITIN